MKTWLRFVFQGRPWWINALMVFCAYMAFVYVPWDFFTKPVAEDQEVWLGILFTGWAAKVGEPLHWAVYAAGAYGFYRMRSWMWPWAAIYVLQIAVATGVWSVLQVGGLRGWIFGGTALFAFSALAAVLWRARGLFGQKRATMRERYGEWALITGASAGIGAEFARALAAEGLSCVLTARRDERLRALASELEKAYQVNTRVVRADLADPAGGDALAEAVDDLEISVLVNNAGSGYAGRFHKQDPDRLREMVQLNCVAPVVLTGRILPGMRKRGRGAVLITGSVAGRQTLPLHGVYSATKAFDLLFGEALWVELREEGIDVLVVEPGSTATEFQEVAGEVAHPGESAAKVVRDALDALGRRPSVIPGWVDWLRAVAAARLLPRSLVAYIARTTIEARIREEMR